MFEKEVRVDKGDVVEPFAGANTSLGTLFLRADTRKEMDEILSRINEWVSIELES